MRNIAETRLKATILGSFKFKKEIDLTREELEDNGVLVLAPEKGGVYSPPAMRNIVVARNFRPLPSERNMPIKVIEDGFLRAIGNSDLAYVVNVDGYVGEVVSMEMGFAIGLGVPLYCRQPIDTKLDLDPTWVERVKNIKAKSATEAVADVRKNLEDTF